MVVENQTLKEEGKEVGGEGSQSDRQAEAVGDQGWAAQAAAARRLAREARRLGEAALGGPMLLYGYCTKYRAWVILYRMLLCKLRLWFLISSAERQSTLDRRCYIRIQLNIQSRDHVTSRLPDPYA